MAVRRVGEGEEGGAFLDAERDLCHGMFPNESQPEAR